MSVSMAVHEGRVQKHVLIATVAIQGHINPVRHLARRLARNTGVRVTVAIPLSSHRRMFPLSKSPDVVEGDHLVSYAAYSDGFDDRPTHDGAHFTSQLKLVGSQTLARLALSLASRGRPVTCVLYTTLAHWASDVAHDVLGVPSFLLLTQPAAVFSIYHQYFNHHLSGDRQQVLQQLRLNIAGLPLQLEIEDLPTVLTDANNSYLASYADIMKTLEKDRKRSTLGGRGRPARVVINTFHALEADVIEAIKGDLEFVTVGPLMEKQEGGDDDGRDGGDLFERDKSSYLQWLDGKKERSVVYISFGSLSMLSKVQMEEIMKGLKQSRRPYLLVVRKDTRDKHLLQQSSKVVPLLQEGEEGGMVVEWCDQVRVLSHRAVGCFLTHCGWNSTMESIVHGVPMVVVPQRIDQPTNARMVEGLWGNGVRAATEGEGQQRVMRGKELVRCLDVVMGDDPRGARIREKAKVWKEKAGEAVADGGSSIQNLMAFVNGI